MGHPPHDRLGALETKVRELRKDFDTFVAARREEENKRLRTGLIVAFTVVTALSGFIWWEIVWPAIKLIRGPM